MCFQLSNEELTMRKKYQGVPLEVLIDKAYKLKKSGIDLGLTGTIVYRSGQTRRGSLAESLTNIVVGYGVAFFTQVLIFPWFGLHASTGDNLKIGAIFTVVSLIRSYGLRRAFNFFSLK